MTADDDSLNQAMVDAFLAHDLDAIAECYADDAVLYGPGGEIVRGRDGCRQSFAAMFERFEVLAFDWDDYSDQVGEFAYHWGSWKWKARVRASGEEVVIDARTTDVRRRGTDGRWRIVLDHASVPLPSS